MKTNSSQVKKDGLPINSEEEKVQKNSMRLYVYLVSISSFQGKDKPRFFTQRDFTVGKIHTILGMHDRTIRKYWRILEDSGMIKYEGKTIYAENQDEWNKAFMERKKISTDIYTINKGQKYRIIPKETIEKLQRELLVNEQELKVYLLLANMQEHFCYMKQEPVFTLTDLRELLKLSKKTENTKSLLLALFWLEKIGLVDYEILNEKNNLGESSYCIKLKVVNYYTNGGDIEKLLNSPETEKLTAELKQNILNVRLLDFEN